MPAEGPIAVDAMGGDGAPQAIVRGALEAVTESGIPVHLVGPQKRLRRELGRFRFLPTGLELVDAPEVVGMDDPAISVLRGKPNGTLFAAAPYASGNKTVAVAVGDLDEDGVPDVVAANRDAKTVRVFLGVGDGTLSPQAMAQAREVFNRS